jgi:hypothetical protein
MCWRQYYRAAALLTARQNQFPPSGHKRMGELLVHQQHTAALMMSILIVHKDLHQLSFHKALSSQEVAVDLFHLLLEIALLLLLMSSHPGTHFFFPSS